MIPNPHHLAMAQPPIHSDHYSKIVAGLGAVGVALQNYPAVVLFIESMAKGMVMTQASSAAMHATAIATGGLCSGFVNFWMNVELLKDFSTRMASQGEWQFIRLKLNTWQKLQYFGGILVFIVTGLLFGLMAFTFAMEGPLAILSIVAGIFVAGIMTIQELETWLDSYDHPVLAEQTPLSPWQKLGKYCGHMIAIGNVVALSLLFALSLANALISFHVAAFPALVIGFFVAFTFGAFTEYYFYNRYLSDFCKNIDQKWADIKKIPQAWMGFLCIVVNAFVNGALTYAGVELLQDLFIAASILLPSTALTALAILAAVFAGTASLILGTNFWLRQNTPPVAAILEKDDVAGHHVVSLGNNYFSKFGQLSASTQQPLTPTDAVEEKEIRSYC